MSSVSKRKLIWSAFSVQRIIPIECKYKSLHVTVFMKYRIKKKRNKNLDLKSWRGRDHETEVNILKKLITLLQGPDKALWNGFSTYKMGIWWVSSIIIAFIPTRKGSYLDLDYRIYFCPNIRNLSPANSLKKIVFHALLERISPDRGNATSLLHTSLLRFAPPPPSH